MDETNPERMPTPIVQPAAAPVRPLAGLTSADALNYLLSDSRRGPNLFTIIVWVRWLRGASGCRGSLLSLPLALWAVGCAAHGGLAAEPPERPQKPGVSNRLPWHGEGVWLHGDPHIHNLLSGRDEHSAIATAAAASGLDFIVSTEHAQHAITVRIPKRLSDLRRRLFDIIILAGIEWNVPAAGHASLIVEQSPTEWAFLKNFADKFDRKVYRGLKHKETDHENETWGSLARAKKGLRWLESARRTAPTPGPPRRAARPRDR